MQGEQAPRAAAVVAPLGGDARLYGDRAEAALQVRHTPQPVTPQLHARASRHGAGDGGVAWLGVGVGVRVGVGVGVGVEVGVGVG